MTTPRRPTALITGASAGIGTEFARQLAALGHDLVLVARDSGRLETLAAELEAAYRVGVEVLPVDLADRAQVATVAGRLAAPARPVDVLVNNAGYGLATAFADSPLAEEERLLDVLVRAPLVLTHTAVQAMRARGHGRIINVGSVAAYLASGTYAAAKSYLTVLTEALAGQLAGTGVTATVVAPGFTRTEFHERAHLTVRQVPDWMWLDASSLVRAALADAGRGVVVSVPSARYKAMLAGLRLLPRRVVRSRLTSTHRPSAN